MSETLAKYDELLKDDGPSALVARQWLRPVGDEVVFPPTYANPSQKKGDPPVYNLDVFGDRSVCVIDSIPSQANRIEPAFEKIADGKLVPQVVVKVPKTDETVNLLSAGHRAADAIVRFSSLAPQLEKAFKARLDGDSLPLAKLAPTSLVFGMWDSRGSGLKLPRLLNAIVRAYDVDQHTRSAQYVPAIEDYAEAGVTAEKGERGLRKLADQGMAAVPATGMLGGVTARDCIRRDTSLNLCTLRDITTPDEANQMKLRRYILGLSLVAFTYLDGKTLNLRQGCQLVADSGKPMTRTCVYADGTEKPFAITDQEAITFAQAAAADFGVETGQEATFDPKMAKEALKASKEEGQ